MTPDEARADYSQRLIVALRLKEVPGDRIGEIVAEVESHVAETGEDPVSAFGTPRQYAASLTEEHRPTPWWQTVAIVVLSAAAGWLTAEGVFAVVLGESRWGMSGWLWIALGVTAGSVCAAILRRSPSSAVRDPRTGEDMVPLSPGIRSALVGIPVALVLVPAVAIRILG